MKLLVVLSAVLACSLAEPTYAYSTLGYAGGVVAPGLLAPGLAYPGVIAPTLAARSYLGHIGAPVAVAPAAVAAPVVEARAALPAAPVVAAPAIAAAPVVAAPAIAAAPVVAAPAIAAAPVVAAKAAIPAPVVAAAPVFAVAAAPVTKTQYHSQDELGNAAFGHAEPGQVHTSVQDALGNRVGSFSYLNPTDGQVHRTDYVADSLGYRVAANDLPVGPAAPVADTPEVAAAKAAHLAAKEEVAHRSRRSILTTPAATAPLATPLAIAAPLPYAAHIAAPAPVVAAPFPYAAHLGLPATLTTIVNNPGHAVSYRID